MAVFLNLSNLVVLLERCLAFERVDASGYKKKVQATKRRS